MPAIPDGLPSIGKASLVILRQRGIATALDVVLAGSTGHQHIPGFGPAKWSVFVDWAQTDLDFSERMALIEGRRKVHSGPYYDVVHAAVYGAKLSSQLGRNFRILALDAVGHLDTNPNTFAWWRSELSREATPSRLTLLPVATPLLPREPAPVDVVLPSGIVVRVPLGGDLFESADRESNRFPTGCSSVAWTRKTGDVIDY